MTLATGCVCLAGVLFVLVSGGVAVYSNYVDPDPAALPPQPGNPVRTAVGIAQDAESPLTDDDVNALVREAVARAGGLDEVIQSGDTVVLKPNLVQDGWDATQGVTTDPRVAAAVVELCWEAGAGEVIIAEGTAAELGGDGPRGVTWDAYHDSRYDLNRDRFFDYDTRVSLVDLNDTGGTDMFDPAKVTLVTIPNGVIRTQYWVPNIILECDVLICMPTFKNHSNGTVTLALKNRVGCAPNDIYHRPGWTNMKFSGVHSVDLGFPRNVSGPDVPPATTVENMIVQYTMVDLNLVRPNDFAVVDALLGVMNGPNEQPIETPTPPMQMIVAGEDSVAVDAVCSLAMGYDPTPIPSIAWADNRELGTMNTGYITVAGDHVAAVRHDFPIDHGIGAERAESVSPWLNDISLVDGETVIGPVIVYAGEYGDNVGVVKVELTVDGVMVDSVIDPTDPFIELVWETYDYPPEGRYDVAVTVYDAALNEASISRDVWLNQCACPYIYIEGPSSQPVTLVCQNPDPDQIFIKNVGPWELHYGIATDAAWLSVATMEGVLQPNEATWVGISYELGETFVDLAPGVHQAMITVSDLGGLVLSRSERVTLTVDTIPSDLDRDGDVDQSDFGFFQACLTAPGISQDDPNCLWARIDDDLDVDIDDFGIIQACMSGPNVCPDPDCEADAPQ